MPWVVFSSANSRRPRKQNPATWVSHSAGFAIRSPRGMGEPHDIAPRGSGHLSYSAIWVRDGAPQGRGPLRSSLIRSEEHTSELQSRVDLVCRLLLEKKK